MTERDLFEAALDMPSENRSAYLDSVCGSDLALRQRLAGLLGKHDQAGNFLEEPAAPSVATFDQRLAEGPGTVIGPYKLLEQIGEGGFAVVFMAEQSVPVRRKVALKVLKPGMDTRQVVARFEAERQALALMDHPNIARILDAGTTNTGRPYFVMDLVRGVPITEFCDQSQLPLTDRLELFVSVCQAVQHAHHKGIIHRDIKPTNVLVTLHDGTPVPIVIDFGIAKAMGQQLTDKTLFTNFAQMVGTPLYMSPEQVALSGLDVDTRSDIYSLGVLLYELLTSTTPFPKERFKEAEYDEIRRIIREEEPPKPSTRLSDSRDTLATISARRHTEPAKLTRLVRGELDWIVMKALEKDRKRRYDTAGALALDVQRYLHGEPVSACPPSAWYRVRKLAWRQRWPLALAGVVAAALIVIAAGSLVAALSLHATLRESEGNRLRAEGAEQNARQAENAAREAEKTAVDRLYRSLLAQARASRFSRRMGQRFESLEAVAQAARILQAAGQADKESYLGRHAERSLELRNEAIAAMALPDLRVDKEWNGHPPDGYAWLDFDDNLERYVQVDQQGHLKVRRVADNNEIASLQLPVGDPWTQLSRDGRYVALEWARSGAKVWRLGGAEPELVVQQPDPLVGVAFSPDSSLVAIPDRKHRMINIYELAAGECRWRLPVKEGFGSLAFAPRRPYLAIGMGGAIDVRNYRTGELVAQLSQPDTSLAYVAWNPDGKVIAAAGVADGCIYLWNIVTAKQIGKLEGIRSGGVRFSFTHGGDLLVSTGWEGVLRLWDWRTGRQLFSTPGYSFIPRFSADDHLLAADVLGKTVRLWKMNSARQYRTLVRDPALGAPVYRHAIAIDPTGRLLAATMADGACFFDLKTCEQVDFMPFQQGSQGAQFERSGALLIYGESGLLRWPNAQTGLQSTSSNVIRLGPLERLPMPGAYYVMAASADGSVIASPRATADALVLDRSHPQQPVHLRVEADARDIAVSPDGKWVATGLSFDRQAEATVWDAHTGKRVRDLPVAASCAVAFSPDRKWLATSTTAGVRFWSVGTWTQPKQSTESARPFGPVPRALAFSPDSAMLAVPSSAGAIRLIQVPTGRELARLEDPNQDVASALAFSPDGTLLVAVSELARSLHIWDLALIRSELVRLNLDWELPSYRPSARSLGGGPLKLELDTMDWIEKATGCVNLGQWRKAAEAYDEALRVDPTNALWCFERACMHLQMRDVDGYRKLCVHMRERVGKSTDAWDILFLAHTWALGPQAPENVALVPKLAEQRFALTQSSPAHRTWSEHVLGLAYYRAGQPAKAVAALQKCLKEDPSWRYRVLNELVLAMAEQRLGHATEARRWLEQAEKAIAQKNKARTEKSHDFAPPGWVWRDWIIVQLLQDEAQRLIAAGRAGGKH